MVTNFLPPRVVREVFVTGFVQPFGLRFLAFEQLQSLV